MAGRWTLPRRITVHRAGQLCFSRNTFLANTSERCLWWCDEQWRLAAVFWAPKMSFKISRSTAKILQETWPPSNRRVAASATFVSRQWPFLLLTVNATNPEAFPPQKKLFKWVPCTDLTHEPNPVIRKVFFPPHVPWSYMNQPAVALEGTRTSQKHFRSFLRCIPHPVQVTDAAWVLEINDCIEITHLQTESDFATKSTISNSSTWSEHVMLC